MARRPMVPLAAGRGWPARPNPSPIRPVGTSRREEGRASAVRCRNRASRCALPGAGPWPRPASRNNGRAKRRNVAAPGHGRRGMRTWSDHAGRRCGPARLAGQAGHYPRLVRAIVAAAAAVTGAERGRRRQPHPHPASARGHRHRGGHRRRLFVPALRNADMLDGNGVRAAIKRLRAGRGPLDPVVELSGYI